MTDLLGDRSTHELAVSVWDPTDTWTQARGKQVTDPLGIWYTSVTGIWQTVWLEPVPAQSIESLSVAPDRQAGGVRIQVDSRGGCEGCNVRLRAYREGALVGEATGSAGSEVLLAVEAPQLWSPDQPNLYDLDVVLASSDEDLDRGEQLFRDP